MKFVTIRDIYLTTGIYLRLRSLLMMLYGRGKGHSKSEADQQAAKDALSKIVKLKR